MNTKAEIVNVYRRRAGNYDLTANLYYIIGFREQAYRRKAVDALDLQEGDTVVELCCGTGLNFSLLEQKIKKTGRLVGVDMMDAMLEKARERVKERKWSNVELIHHDAGSYGIPIGIDGVISTFALALVPEYDTVIKEIHASLRPGGKFALLDFKLPNNALRHLAPLGVFITKPFAIEMELTERHLWESIEKYFPKFSMTNMFGGFTYLAVGEK